MDAKAVSKLIAKYVDHLEVEREKEIKVKFNISGEFVARKGKDYSQDVSFAVPYDKIVLLLLSKLNGVTVESVLREALEGNFDSSVIKAEAEEALKKIKGESKRKCSGKVTVSHENIKVNELDTCEYC